MIVIKFLFTKKKNSHTFSYPSSPLSVCLSISVSICFPITLLCLSTSFRPPPPPTHTYTQTRPTNVCTARLLQHWFNQRSLPTSHKIPELSLTLGWNRQDKQMEFSPSFHIITVCFSFSFYLFASFSFSHHISFNSMTSLLCCDKNVIVFHLECY